METKRESGAQLTNFELALRWWDGLSVKEKEAILKEHLPSYGIGNMNNEYVYWVWLKQQSVLEENKI